MDPAHDDPEDAKSQHTTFQEENRDREHSSDTSSLDSLVSSEYGRYCNTAQIDPDIANTHKKMMS